ncbi:unnamed protein product [Heligmosomoides polygyrus]|uniref:BRCT domain-containing protein n=1 Tax=Heligmosomoides polygyrus TaxID=6339 RepID=A0A183F4F4_HELPZ|nr:unnamed protein product [Heligmosomoides polygyrus]
MDQKRKSLEISKSTAPSDDDADDENDESLSQRSAVSRRQKQRGSRRKSRRQSVADPSSAAASPRSSSQVMCTDSSTPIQQKSAPQTPERPAMQETAAAASTPRREPSPASECRSVADPITAAASPRSSSQVMCTDSSTPIQQKSAPQTPELLAMQETAAAASTPRREPSPASECQSVADPITAAASPRSSSQVMCTDSSTPIRQKSAPQTPERPAVQETAAAASTPRREPSSGEDSDSNSWADWTVSPFESPVKQKQGQGQDETVGDSLSCDKNPMPSQESICAAEETLQKPPTVPEISVQNLAEETEQECGTVQKPLDGKKSPLLSQESTASSEESLKETHTTPESPLQKSAEEVGRQGETLHKSLAGDRSPLPLEEIPGKSAIVKNPEQEPVEETEHQHDITAQKQTSLAGKRKRLQSQGSATPSKRIPKKPAIAPENPEEELAKKKEQQHSLTVPKQKSHAGKRKRLSSQRSATPSKETPKKAPIASENPEEELAEETEQHGGTAQTQKPPACKRKRLPPQECTTPSKEVPKRAPVAPENPEEELAEETEQHGGTAQTQKPLAGRRKRLPPQESATPSKKTPKKPSAAPENPAEELAEEKEQHGGTAQTQKPLAGKRKRLSSQGSATPSKKTPKKPSATPENPTEEPPLTKSPAGASRPPPSQPAALDVTHAPAQPSPPLLVQPPSTTTRHLQTTTRRLQTTTLRLQTTTRRLQTTTRRLQTTTRHLQTTTRRLQTAARRPQATSPALPGSFQFDE